MLDSSNLRNILFGNEQLMTYRYSGEVLVRMSKHQGRANALKTLNEGISCIRKYVAEYNVLNLARETDPRESPLPRDNKGSLPGKTIKLLLIICP